MGDMHNSMIEQGQEGGRIVSASAPPSLMKTCSKCGVDKSLDAFAKNAACKQGVRPDCKQCWNAAIKEWKKEYRKRPDVATKESAYRRSPARQQVLQRHSKTEAFKKTQRDWIARNPAKKNALTATRRASQAQRTPAWDDQRYIDLFYEIARLESERTGRCVEVDHMIPLRGTKVSGLHVENNLQLLFKEDNVKKGCRHD